MKNRPLFILFVTLLLGSSLYAQKQGQELIDSLQTELSKAKADTNRVNILNGLSQHAGWRIGNIDTALYYAQTAETLAEKMGFKTGTAGAYYNIGVIYTFLSDYSKALEYFQRALSINEETYNKSGIASNLNGIGIIYYKRLSDYPKALEYFQRSLSSNEELGNKNGIAVNLSNIGNIYIILSDYPKALEYYQRALSSNEEIGNKINIATCLGNIGTIYRNLSNYPKALEYFQGALSIYEQIDSKGGMAVNLGNIGSWYLNVSDSILQQMNINTTDRYATARSYADSALAINTETGDLNGQKFNQQLLSEIYEKEENYSKAYEAYKTYIVLRDNIQGEEVKSEITRKEMQYEFEKKETVLKFQQQLTAEQLEKQRLLNQRQEQDLTLSNNEKELQHLAYLKQQADLEKEKAQRQEKEKQLTLSEKEKALQASQLATQQQEIETKNAQRNLFIAGTVLFLLLASSVFVGLRRTQKEKKVSEALRVQSDNLLRNILPSEIAEELKEKGNTQAKQYNDVSILFTDFVSFTQTAEQLSPQQLVQELHECFTAFDNITDRNGLEKIKTIGDAYLAVCGLPVSNPQHALRTVQAALEIRDFIEERKKKEKTFDIRIGIHSGSVVAGIVGVKKFAYDIWGDTVNTAARMESSGEAGKVNISEMTYQLVINDFICEYRGEIEAKGKGKMGMYFVSE